MIGSDRFKKLEEKGAQKQRVLYASTGTKDPSFSDVLYVESIIGKDSINTLPIETIDAFRDHGLAAETLTTNLRDANKQMVELKDTGIDLDKITRKLEDEGIEKFNQAFEKLIKSIDSQKRKL